jgi:hypothetical protein
MASRSRLVRLSRSPQLVTIFVFGFAATVALDCAAVRRAKEKQATSVEMELASSPERVHQAALRVLPELDLIPTSEYVAGGFIEAHGDWGTPREGAVVQVSTRVDGDATRVVVEAGHSARLSKAEMRALARAILDRITAELSAESVPGS